MDRPLAAAAERRRQVRESACDHNHQKHKHRPSWLPLFRQCSTTLTGANQLVLIESVVVRNSAGRTVYVFDNSDATRKDNGACKVILPKGFPVGDHLTLVECGLSSPFKLETILKFTIRTDQHSIKIRED